MFEELSAAAEGEVGGAGELAVLARRVEAKRAKLVQLNSLRAENARLKAQVDELFAAELSAQAAPTQSFVAEWEAAEDACNSSLYVLARQRAKNRQELARLDDSLAEAARRNASLRKQPRAL